MKSYYPKAYKPSHRGKDSGLFASKANIEALEREKPPESRLTTNGPGGGDTIKSQNSPTPGRDPETNEGGTYRRSHVPRDEARGLAWLRWQSNGCDHGLRPHHVNSDGTVREIGDPEPTAKPDVIRMRQARRFAKRGRA